MSSLLLGKAFGHDLRSDHGKVHEGVVAKELGCSPVSRIAVSDPKKPVTLDDRECNSK